jgi:hypothetical protein
VGEEAEEEIDTAIFEEIVTQDNDDGVILESVRADEEIEVEVEVVFEEVDIEEDVGEGDEEGGGGGVKDRGDMTEMPYVVRTVESVTGHSHHTHAPGADSDNDGDGTHCTPHLTTAAPFFPQEEDRMGQVLVYTPSEADPLNSDIPQNIVRAANGIDFVFLETFISKEDEVFVTFDGTMSADRTQDGVSEEGEHKPVESETEVVAAAENMSTVQEQSKPVKNKELKVKKKKKQEAPKKKLS